MAAAAALRSAADCVDRLRPEMTMLPPHIHGCCEISPCSEVYVR